MFYRIASNIKALPEGTIGYVPEEAIGVYNCRHFFITYAYYIWNCENKDNYNDYPIRVQRFGNSVAIELLKNKKLHFIDLEVLPVHKSGRSEEYWCAKNVLDAFIVPYLREDFNNNVWEVGYGERR